MKFPSRARRLAPPPTGADPQAVPLSLGGSWMAGDPSTIPDGYVRKLSNMLIRPGPRYDARPPAVYDGLSSINGLSMWEDLVNQQTRFLAFDTAKLYKKATSGETWDAGTSGLTVTRLTSAANYRGKWYGMFDDGAGNPTVATVWDGTNLSTAPFDSSIVSRIVVTYGDRLFFFYPRVTVTPLTQGFGGLDGTTYDFTNVGWQKTAVTVKNITANGVTTCRLYPTSTTASSMRVLISTIAGEIGLTYVEPTAATRVVMLRWDLKNTHPTYAMPITLEWLLVTNWILNTAYVVGDLITDASHLYRLRCTTAGTSGGGVEPAWGTTVGSTTVDNTVTWTNEGSAVIGALEDFVPTATESQQATVFSVGAIVPSATNRLHVTPRLKFFNTSTPTITLAPIDASFKDGIADGDLRKKNKGFQATTGSFPYPFINTETATTATINMESIISSETSSVPPLIRASNTYEPKEAAGLPTAGIVAEKRLIMFKRRAFWVFALQADPDNPISAESVHLGTGAISSTGLATLDDELFWIGENECYRMRIGEEPKPFCGDAMREEIMAKGADWVESQSTYNLARLAIDQKNREVYVYTQKGKYYVFNLATGGWSVCDIQGKEIAALAYNSVTTKIEMSLGGFGLIRLDGTNVVYDTIDNTATGYPITKEITLRPIELFHPRAELCLHEIGLYHLITQQTDESATIYVSHDRGATYAQHVSVTPDITQPRIPFSLYQFGVSVMPKISATGYGSAAGLSFSKAEATIELLAGEWPWSQPAQVSSTL